MNSELLGMLIVLYIIGLILTAKVMEDIEKINGYHFASIVIFWPLWLIIFIIKIGIKLLVTSVIELLKFIFLNWR
jgi:hypothetical protein